MPTHSIIIPHRNRHERLALCLHNLCETHHRAPVSPAEVFVVDDNPNDCLVSAVVCQYGAAFSPGLRVVLNILPSDKGTFCKGRLLNQGIKVSSGQIVTFLDADAIVGVDWWQALESLVYRTHLTRLCYRVRIAPSGQLPAAAAELRDGGIRTNGAPSTIEKWFSQWDHLPIGYEAYGQPHLRAADTPLRQPVFGNSQFSIRRNVLGDLRFNEEYVGAGYEDLEFIRALWWKHGRDYCAEIETTPERAMLHIHNVREPDWGVPAQSVLNERRYRNTKPPPGWRIVEGKNKTEMPGWELVN